jgi:hypothetical protein
MAIRYDKLAANYRAFLQLASTRLRLRVKKSTTKRAWAEWAALNVSLGSRATNLTLSATSPL